MMTLEDQVGLIETYLLSFDNLIKTKIVLCTTIERYSIKSPRISNILIIQKLCNQFDTNW